MSIDLSNYLDIFAEEAREHLQALNESLLEFEKEPANLELVNTMFRSAHTLKGMSATMGYSDTAELTHKMENLLALVRQGDLQAGQEVVDLLFRCLDALQEMVEAHIGGLEHSVDISGLVAEMEQLDRSETGTAVSSAKGKAEAAPESAGYPGKLGQAERKAIDAAREDGRGVYHLHVVLRSDCELKNARAYMVVREIKQLGQMIHATPAEQTLTENDFGDSFDLLLASSGPADAVSRAVMSVLEVDHVAITEFQERGAPPAASAKSKPGLAEVFSFNEYDLTVIAEAKNEGFRVVHVRTMLTEDCVLKSARAFMVNKQLEQLGEIVAIHPDVEDIELEKFERELHFLLLTEAPPGSAASALNSVSELDLVEVDEDPVVPASLRLEIERPEAATGAGEGGASPGEESKAAVAAQMSSETEAKKNAAGAKPVERARHTQTIRVDIERLDALLNMVGELVIGKTRLALLASEINRNDLSETISHFGLIVSDLQNLAMQTRMVPIETVFNRFPRMVRDLAKSRNKQIELKTSGGETELDRTVIEEIGDPLVHLIRNSLDHGIETAAEREACGKPSAGILSLSAFHEGSHVFIEVADDGKGIDHEVIRQKVVEKGIVTQEEADALTEEQAVELIFAAGLTTAEKVTDVSGRGVGMDAVVSKLVSLNGEIKVRTEVGVGSKVTIKLPLTLAIVQALLVKIAMEHYAIPLTYIEETLRIWPKQIKKINQQDVYQLRGEILPLVWTRQLLDCPDAPRSDESWYVVVIRSAGQRVGLCVDATVGQMEIVIKSLGNYLSNTKYISGGTILGDGTVALILDVAHIVE
ncbi:chemotaxis protein CheA [bacterium]|nr:chemotaxis protein CheA [bacterium]